jgi:hypothetical protein
MCVIVHLRNSRVWLARGCAEGVEKIAELAPVAMYADDHEGHGILDTQLC